LPRVELPELRTSHSKTFRLGDGRLQVELSAKWPIHYLDANGHWQDCDCNIYGDTDVAEFDHSCKKTWASAIRLAKRAPQPVHIERGGCKLTYRAQGVANVKGQVTGNRLAFVDAWRDADLVWYVVPEGLRKEVVLKSAQAPAIYSFLVEAQSLELRRDEDGVVRAWAGPFPAFELYRPWVQDAYGVPGPVTVTLRTDGGKQYLDLAIDPGWLSDPARVWPVVLDPTTVQPDAAAGKDAYVDSSQSTANFGAATTLVAGTSSAATVKYRSLIEFDVSAYAGRTLGLAQLQLYCYGEGSTTDYAVTVHPVLAGYPWFEGTVTWGNQPAHGSSLGATVITGTGAWFSWTITSTVQGWLDGGANYGLKLIGAGEDVTTLTQKQFYSSDYSTNPALRPKLVLTFVPVATPTSPTGTEASPGTVTDDVSPRLSWTFSDPYESGTQQSHYQVQLYTGDGLNLVVDTGEVASANAYYDCAANLLDYGKTYKWRVKVKSTSGVWGSYSAWQYFVPVLTAPTGLTVTPNAGAARIDLSWTAHSGEDLAGYHVYRKLQGAADTAYVRLNIALVTGTTYVDDTAASGTAYTYAVTAQANDSYESAKSAGVDGTVTFSGYWLGAQTLKLRPEPTWTHRRLTSTRVALDGRAVVQDRGYGPRELRLWFRYDTLAERQTLLDLFGAGASLSYRDEDGRVMRGKVGGDVEEQILEVPGSVVGWLGVTLVEVAAGE